MRRTATNHLSLFVLLAIFAGLVVLYESAIMTYEGPDEPEHSAYIVWLRQTNSLPDPTTDIDTALHQQASQAPLYYVIGAVWSHFTPIDMDTLTIAPAVNPWRAYPAPPHYYDNTNSFLMSDNGHVLTPELSTQIAALWWLRRISLIFGLITVCAVYVAIMVMWQDRRWAFIGAGGVAFTPQLLQASSTITNDAAVIAFASLTVAASIYLYKHPRSRWALILAGLFAGLACLSKTDGLIIAVLPFAVVMLLSDVDWKRKAFRLLVLVVVLMGTGGWWYVRAGLLYGDALGFSTHSQMAWAASGAPDILKVLERVPWILGSLWANFGWIDVLPPFWAFIPPVIALVLAFIGLVYTRQSANTSRRFGFALWLVVILNSLALVYWMRVSEFVPGRLLFPVYPAIVMLVVWGVRRWDIRIGFALVALFFVNAVAIVPATLVPAYGVPVLSDTVRDGLQGQSLVFENGVTFSGYTIDSAEVSEGLSREVTLCWRAPESDQAAIDVPYAFALHVINASGDVVAARDSYPGLGKYTRWQSGKAFCDTFLLKFDKALAPTTVYPLTLALFDVDTLQNLASTTPESAPAQIIGYVYTPAEDTVDSGASMLATFGEQVGLLDLTHNNEALTLKWASLTDVEQGYNVFVHLLDADNATVAQVDVPLGGAEYPSWAWSAGEAITQDIALPLADLSAGTYQMVMGVYAPVAPNYPRLPTINTEGVRLMNDAYDIGEIVVD